MTVDEDGGGWRDIVASALDWSQAHVSLDDATRDLAPALRGRRPDGMPHSAWELLDHVGRTQADLVEFMTNPAYQARDWPGDYWPARPVPPDADAWPDALRRIERDRERLRALALDEALELTERIPWGDGQTYLRTLLVAVDHASYHVGQLVLVRRQLGAWPADS